MAPDCDHDALDALARGEVIADRADLDRHLARCAPCERELAWLRAERDLMRARAAAPTPVEHLWGGISDRLGAPVARATVSPYRTPAPVLEPRPTRPWRAFVAGVAAATAFFAVAAAITFKVDRARRVTATPSVRSRPVAHASRTDAPPRIVETPVTGAVRLRVETWSADVVASSGRDDALRVIVRDADAAPQVTRAADGRYELRFDGGRLAHGRLELVMPRGSELDVTTGSGDISVSGVGGPLQADSTSGSVRGVDLRLTRVTVSSGDVELSSLGGDATVRTVSGDVRIDHSAAAGAVSIETSSGDVEWGGSCAVGCQLQARTVSGDVRIHAERESGFGLRFGTVSGELRDELGTGAALPESGSASGRYGSGVGSVAVSTTSGSLTIQPR